MNLINIAIAIVMFCFIVIICTIAVWICLENLSEPFKVCKRQGWNGTYNYSNWEGEILFDCQAIKNETFVETANSYVTSMKGG